MATHILFHFWGHAKDDGKYGKEGKHMLWLETTGPHSYYCHKGIPDGYPKVNQDFCEISWSLNVDSCWCPKKYYGHQIKHPWAELGGQLACSLCFNSQHFWNLIFHHMTLSLSVLSLPSASN